MLKFTSEELRKLADIIDNEHKYHNKRGYVILTIKEYPSGKKYAEFEQPSDYAECSSAYHTYNEK